MSTLWYLSHPQVRIDPDVPVPRWGLSDVGRRRVEAAVALPWVAEVRRVVSSGETKALETAAIVSAAIGVPIEVRAALHENDRSATGFVPADRFESLADRFFALPETSVEGWEPALAAQRRVVAATRDLVEPAPGDALLVGHGGVGTLLLCHLAGWPIDRRHDQAHSGEPGGGNVWSYDRDRRELLHPWRPIDA